MSKFVKFLLPCVATLLSAGMAHAAGISGSAYCNVTSSYAANSPTYAQLSDAKASSGGLCATFTANSINFASGGDLGSTGTSLASFLNFQSGNLTSSTYYATAAKNGGTASNTAGSQSQNGTLFDITGSTHLVSGQTVNLSHDDGALIYLTGGSYLNTLISPAGGSAQTVAGQCPFTFNGPTGTYTFELIYDSNYLAPAELVSDIANIPNVAQTPEPSSLVLLGSGILTLAGAVRRRIR